MFILLVHLGSPWFSQSSSVNWQRPWTLLFGKLPYSSFLYSVADWVGVSFWCTSPQVVPGGIWHFWVNPLLYFISAYKEGGRQQQNITNTINLWNKHHLNPPSSRITFPRKEKCCHCRSFLWPHQHYCEGLIGFRVSLKLIQITSDHLNSGAQIRNVVLSYLSYTCKLLQVGFPGKWMQKGVFSGQTIHEGMF